MNPLHRVISAAINILLRPLICRIEDRLRPIHDLHARLDRRLDALELTLAPPFMSQITGNEIQNIDSLPLSLLENMADLTVVGYSAGDLAAVLPGCTVAPVTDWIASTTPIRLEAPLGNLLFLDEYYFVRTMERITARVLPLAESIIVATRFDYLGEARCRSILHQTGFMEVALVARDAVTGELGTFAVSHASPVSCEPIFLDESRPPAKPGDPAIWLVARRTAWHGAQGWPHA